MNWVSKPLHSDTSCERGTLIRKSAHVLTLTSNGPGTLNKVTICLKKNHYLSKSICLNK